MTALLSVSGMVKTYETARGTLRAVDGVSFDVGPGETLAVVGESGCGKSTIALSTLRLADIDAGAILFNGDDLVHSGRNALRDIRRQIGVVFQNPYSSLNPRMKIEDVVGEPLTTIGLHGGPLRERVLAALNEVGLGAEHLRRFPHQFSGGQRQRIAIARALITEPKLIVLDEPTAALDVSVQAQVLNLLKDLQARKGVGYLFISHDLATVRFIADRVMVMYLGRIVESGNTADVFKQPRHPYTRALLDAVPSVRPALKHKLKALTGEIPSPLNLPDGCAFAGRCAHATDLCHTAVPELSPFDDGRLAACHHPLNTEFQQ